MFSVPMIRNVNDDFLIIILFPCHGFLRIERDHNCSDSSKFLVVPLQSSDMSCPVMPCHAPSCHVVSGYLPVLTVSSQNCCLLFIWVICFVCVFCVILFVKFLNKMILINVLYSLLKEVKNVSKQGYFRIKKFTFRRASIKNCLFCT